MQCGSAVEVLSNSVANIVAVPIPSTLGGLLGVIRGTITLIFKTVKFGKKYQL